ncbi:MAG: hypothetical protein ACJAWL_002954 [Motiliproteus sp.]|jgi:hypothetical protein
MSDDFNPAEQPKWRSFGSNAALSVEATRLLVKGEPAGWTVAIDVAPIENRETQWPRKVSLMVSETELPILASVLLGYLPKCQFQRSGKGIYIERQPGKLFLRGSHQAENYALPLTIGATFHFSALVLQQLQKHCGGIETDTMLAALRGSAALYQLKQESVLVNQV